MQTVIIWLVLLTVSFFTGGIVARYWKWRHPILFSGIVCWLVFLAINIVSERISPDYEVVQGIWPLIQITVGSGVAMLGVIGAITFKKLSRSNS